MSSDKRALSLYRSWIIGGAQGYPKQQLPHLLQKLISLCPACMLNDDPGGIAVESRVVCEHRHEMFGLVCEVARAPGTWHHYDRADVAKLPRDMFGQQWLVLR